MLRTPAPCEALRAQSSSVSGSVLPLSSGAEGTRELVGATGYGRPVSERVGALCASVGAYLGGTVISQEVGASRDSGRDRAARTAAGSGLWTAMQRGEMRLGQRDT